MTLSFVDLPTNFSGAVCFMLAVKKPNSENEADSYTATVITAEYNK